MKCLLLAALCLLTACAGRRPVVEPAPAGPVAEHLPVEALLWKDPSSAVDPVKILAKEGTLRRTSPPEPDPESQVRYWPFSLDYWGITRTDLEDVLKPYLGRPVRVEGEYRKTYAHEKWIYEVDPVRITLLPTP